MITTLEWRKVTIRKPHRCWGCRRLYEKGQQLYYWSCVEDGRFGHGYTCDTCEEIMKLDDEHDNEYPKGFVADNLNKDQTPEQLLQEIKDWKDERQRKIRESLELAAKIKERCSDSPCL